MEESADGQPPHEERGEEPAQPGVIEAPPARPPGIGETIGRSLDLVVTATPQIRRTSIYIGVLTVLVLGPFTVLLLALIRTLGQKEALNLIFDLGIGPTGAAAAERALPMLRLSSLLGVVGFLAVAIESEILSVAILGGAATGGPIGVRRGLSISRRVFWRVAFALVIIGIPRVLAGRLVIAAMAPHNGGQIQLAAILQVVVEAIVAAPFSFVLAGIVLGGGGVLKAIRGSIRIARARWRLAILVTSVGAAVSLIQTFAIGTGVDILARVGAALGLGLDGSGSTAVLTSLLVLVGLLALGSLVLTVAALTAAPQVVAFLAMSGERAGLDDRPPVPSRQPRLITWPMLGLVALAAAAAAAGIASL